MRQSFCAKMITMRNALQKIFIIFVLFVAAISCSLADTSNISDEKHLANAYTSSAEGIVKRIDYDYAEQNDNPEEISKQIVTVKITKGQFKGKEKITENLMTGNPAYEVFLKEGDRVLLIMESASENPKSIDEIDIFITDIKRIGTVYLYTAFFILFLIVIGKKKGLMSLLSIIITVLLIFAIFVPLVLWGVSPILSALIISVLSTVATMYLVAGYNSKTNAAVLGTVLSLIFASALAMLAVKLGHLTGFMGEESVFLYTQRPDLSFTGILAASIIIAALGALMDVAVSIASTINEIHLTDENLGIIQLFKSGMNVGRDIIGTMANTLILVYLGSAMPLALLSSNIDAGKFFNLNQVASEILSALTGSISLLACVPLTAIMAAYMVKRKEFCLIKMLSKLPLFKNLLKNLQRKTVNSSAADLPLLENEKDSKDDEQKAD